ncbi:MAG: LacI family transcriptional regulator [Chloroflexi bacterium]|nr:LacI family transcriptional regulator [Chloroflexota bacterium]
MAEETNKKKRMPTIFDIARESGFSYSTVSRTLSGFEFVKPSTREKIVEAAERLGYVPNQQARSLAGGPSHLIGVLVPTLTNDYIIQILQGIDDELTRSSYNLILYTTNRHQGTEATYVATIMNGAADGLLLVAPFITDSYLEALNERDFPYVLIDQDYEAEDSMVVKATNREGAYIATQYLIKMGHSRIGFIAGLPQLNSAIERLAGFREALSDHGIPFREEYVVPGNFEMRGGYRATRELLARSDVPTAIFAANDLSALGAIEAIRERGLRIPLDISILGFDDIPQAAVAYPKLTTVRQPLNQMGREAVNLLLKRLQNPDMDMVKLTLNTQLIIRDSCDIPFD